MSLTDLIRRRSDCTNNSNNSNNSRSSSLQDDNNGGLFEFDVDDPDFAIVSSGNGGRCANFNMNMSGLRKVQTSPMTLTSLHRSQNVTDQQRPANDNSFRSDRSTSATSLTESDRSCDSSNRHSTTSSSAADHSAAATDNMLTIENLRHHLNSCFSCGVSWQDEHVSLDCSECGGYSLSRPCPLCDGQCGRQWKRDLAASHSLAKANWNGVCSLNVQKGPTSQADLIIHRLHGLSTS